VQKKEIIKKVKIKHKAGRKKIRFFSSGSVTYDFRGKTPPFEIDERHLHLLERDFEIIQEKPEKPKKLKQEVKDA